MGKPDPLVGGFRDDPDDLSLHTTAEDDEDLPDYASLDGDVAGPSGHAEATYDARDEEEVMLYRNIGSTPETHFSYTSSHIGGKRTRIGGEVIQQQDKRTDANPDLLEGWIRVMAGRPPSQYINIVGTHQESRRDKNGKKTREQVTDFRIMVSLENYLCPNFDRHGPNEMNLTTVESGEKTYRGTVFKQRAPGVKGEIEVGHVKPTLTEWCHRYCANATATKVFRLSRVVTGLDKTQFRDRLEELIRSTNYRGKLVIEFPVANRAVDIYSTSPLNNWRLITWVKWLFYLTFLWIFSWPILFFSTKRYHVVRAEWPFSQTDAQGQKRYTTISEIHWIHKYGGAIQQLCMDRYQGLSGDSHLNQVIARGESRNNIPVEGRAILGVAAAALSGGFRDATTSANSLMRLVGGGPRDQVGWGFDT